MKDIFNKREVIETIQPVIENTAMRYGLILLETLLERENNRWFLRIFIYSHEHKVSHQDCENMSRGLGDMLDELIPFKYFLEVSSPGLERKFKSDKEFVIFKGRRVSIKLKTPLDGESERIFKGEIIDWDDNEGLTFLRFEDGEELQIPKSNIQSAKLYID